MPVLSSAVRFALRQHASSRAQPIGRITCSLQPATSLVRDLSVAFGASGVYRKLVSLCGLVKGLVPCIRMCCRSSNYRYWSLGHVLSRPAVREEVLRLQFMLSKHRSKRCKHGRMYKGQPSNHMCRDPWVMSA